MKKKPNKTRLDFRVYPSQSRVSVSANGFLFFYTRFSISSTSAAYLYDVFFTRSEAPRVPSFASRRRRARMNHRRVSCGVLITVCDANTEDCTQPSVVRSLPSTLVFTNVRVSCDGDERVETTNIVTLMSVWSFRPLRIRRRFSEKSQWLRRRV